MTTTTLTKVNEPNAGVRKMVMHRWLKISLLLCVFGFFKEIRPSEPFIYEYLIGPWRNIDAKQVTESVYPVGTYSYLAQSIVIFLITDLLKYKPLIVCLGLSGIVVWAMLIWTTSLLELQILELFYGTFMATEVAYFTYIYKKVDAIHYQQVTSHVRAALLAGRAVSGVLAQILISFKWMDFKQLNYITFSAMIIATVWSLFLPPVENSIYFHQESEPLISSIPKAFSLMKCHCLTSFKSKYTTKWCLWWALSTCGFIQVQCYMQPLWYEIQDDPNKSIYNGAVESILTVIGFLAALLAGVLNVNWRMKGELTVSICSLLTGFLLLYTSRTNYILLSYACYVSIGGFYHFMITIASSEIAKGIKAEDSYGLIFGINTFLALLLQSLLTVFVVDDKIGFGLTPRDQYFVYGLYHIFVAVIYIIIGLTSWLMARRVVQIASV